MRHQDRQGHADQYQDSNMIGRSNSMLKPLRPLPPGDANVLKGTSQKPKVNVNLQSHRNEVPEEFKSCQAQGKDRWMVGYITYYVFQLLVNQALVSVYAVFVFGEQVVC